MRLTKNMLCYHQEDFANHLFFDSPCITYHNIRGFQISSENE